MSRASIESLANTSSGAEYRLKGRRALRAASLGFFVDMYDVYLPVIALAPAIAYFTAGDSTAVEKIVVASAIFVASIIGRPLGAFLFGPLGDKIGRRRTTIIVAGGFTICTGLMVLLPGYDTLGIWSPIMLILLRLLDGLFLGGEYTAANPLAMEYAPRDKRGLYGSLLNIGYPLALAAITVITIVTLKIFPSGGAQAPYSVWGWRVPFVIGFVISGALFLYYVRAVPESEIWAKMEKVTNPLRKLFSGRNLRSLGLAFMFSTGAWLTLNASIGAFAGHFKLQGVDGGTINTSLLVSALLGAVCFPLVGILGQRFGRRHVIMTLGVLNMVLASLGSYLLVGSVGVTGTFVAFSVLLILPGLLVWAMITAYIMEMFPTEVRASGYGIGYSLPSVIPAFYSYFMIWLSGVMPYEYTPIPLLVVGGGILFAAAYLSKDLRHVQLENA